MYFVFDIESSGLPRGRGIIYQNIEAYDTCRIVSIAYAIVDKYGKRDGPTKYFVVKPENFVISNESIAIHGISNEIAQTGVSFSEVIDTLRNDLVKCDTLVAHNISFDYNALMSELFRRSQNNGEYDMLMETITNMKQFCTMKVGHKKMKDDLGSCKGYLRWPKLINLYKYLTNNDMENAHNAEADTDACLACFIELKFNL